MSTRRLTAKAFTQLMSKRFATLIKSLSMLQLDGQGGTHDSFILRHSSVGQRFSAGDCDGCWLLGDSGYGLKRWLLTPFSDPVTDAQKKFNTSHKKVPCWVCLWRFKKPLAYFGPFRRLPLCYSPAKVSHITIACCILHNICRRDSNPDPPLLSHQMLWTMFTTTRHPTMQMERRQETVSLKLYFDYLLSSRINFNNVSKYNLMHLISAWMNLN